MTRTIALVLPPTPAGVAALRRCWEAGDAVLPLAPDATAAQVAATVATLRPDRVTAVDDPTGRPASRPLPTRRGTALVVTTSGSTGTPKGVVLSRAALDASTRASVDRLGAQPGEVWRVPLPLHHVAGVMAVRRAWAAGTDPDLVAPGDVEALRRPGADRVALVPTQLHRWLATGIGDGPRRVLLGGAAPPPGLLERAAAAGLEVTVSYGMSETCGGCVYDGAPLDGVEVALAEDDRVRLRGPVRFDGYRGDAAATAASLDDDGWFTTGDRARWTEDGRLEVLGRADAVAVSGGENVPLDAVAAALATHPDVAEAAAVDVPDPEWGAAVRAVVVPTAGAVPSLQSLRDHVKAEHPAAWAPRDLVVVARLPRDGLGKVRRDALRELPGHT